MVDIRHLGTQALPWGSLEDGRQNLCCLETLSLSLDSPCTVLLGSHIASEKKKKSQDWWALLGVISGTLCHQTGQYFTQSTWMVGVQLVPKDFCEERLYTHFLFR